MEKKFFWDKYDCVIIFCTILLVYIIVFAVIKFKEAFEEGTAYYKKIKQVGIERVEKIKKGEVKIDKNLKIDKFIETKLKNKLEFSEDDYFDIGKKLEELKIEDF